MSVATFSGWPGYFVSWFLPILVFTCVACVTRGRWGRRGLLIAWPVSTLVMLGLSFVMTLLASEGDIATADATIVALIFGAALVGYLAAFGASAAAVHRLGSPTAIARPVWMQVGAGTLAGIGGAIAATILMMAIGALVALTMR